jgi:hypothetical protein
VPAALRLAISPFWLAACFLAAIFLIVVGIRLAKAGVRVLRTDRHGALRILLDGKAWKSPAMFPAWRLVAMIYDERKRQIRRKTRSSNRKPIAARYSRFLLYCAKENGATVAEESFADVRRGRNKGTARAYSRNASP